MKTTQIDALLRVKRAREQRAMARTAAAQSAAEVATSAAAAAAQAQAAHESARPARLAAAYAALLRQPATTQRVQAETAYVSGLVAVSTLLADQTRDAQAQAGHCALDHAAARAAQAEAMRGCEAAAAIRQVRQAADGMAEERAHEHEDEDLAPALRARRN